MIYSQLFLIPLYERGKNEVCIIHTCTSSVKDGFMSYTWLPVKMATLLFNDTPKHINGLDYTKSLNPLIFHFISGIWPESCCEMNYGDFQALKVQYPWLPVSLSRPKSHRDFISLNHYRHGLLHYRLGRWSAEKMLSMWLESHFAPGSIKHCPAPKKNPNRMHIMCI